MILKIKKQGQIIVPVLLLLFSQAFCEHPDSALYKIEVRKSYFNTAAKLFNIDVKTLISIVYVERILNVDWKDKALDIPMARAGYNSSIGFCQIKLKTAYFIEKTLSDSSNNFFPGHKYLTLLSLSKSPTAIIKKLSIDSRNICYAAAYLRIIESYWSSKGYSLSEKPSILGTLYSIGLFKNDGKPRRPHKSPTPNRFGNEVFKALDLFKTFNSE